MKMHARNLRQALQIANVMPALCGGGIGIVPALNAPYENQAEIFAMKKVV